MRMESPNDVGGMDYRYNGNDVREGEDINNKPAPTSDERSPEARLGTFISPPPVTNKSVVGAELPPSGSVEDVAEFYGVTPEFVYEYVKSRLTDLDGQIKDLQGDVKDRNKRSEELRVFQEAVRTLVGVCSSDGSYDAASATETQSLNNAQYGKVLQDAMNKLKESNPDLYNRLETFYKKIFTEAKIPAAELQTQLDYAKDQLTSLNSSGELTMMRLNMLFQLRNQVVTSGTNEQASINEGMKAIISNMRA